MISASTHRELRAWQESMKLVEMLYRDTTGFPKVELFGLTTQMRRAAVSIPSNIAEGSARNSPGELGHFLGIACGSLAELETQIEISKRLGFLPAASDIFSQLSRVGQLLIALRRSVK
ncbi:MAG: four helix bundle protein [Rhodospirillaceae bacterium]